MLESLEKALQYEVFKMLKKEGKINDAIIENMLFWYHTGFKVYIGDKIEPVYIPKLTYVEDSYYDNSGFKILYLTPYGADIF